MKVAIIGAGFCGLASAWHMLQKQSYSQEVNITLFDAGGIGKGTSGIAAGLLHPFAGAHAKLNWRGLEGMDATKELLGIASAALGRSVNANNPGILRLGFTKQQQEEFQICAEKNPSETEWLDAASCQKLAPGCAEAPALWIKNGLTVYSGLYLQGLWEAVLGLVRNLSIRKFIP